MRTTTVVIRQISEGPEAAAIFDALDAAVELPSDRLTNGRRYTLSGRLQMDRAAAVSILEGELDRISGTWSSHVAIAGLN